MTQAADYSVRKTAVDSIEVIQLADAKRDIRVSIVPSIGNNAYEMTVKGQRIFWSPYSSLRELKEKPTQIGNPFLAPWVNRIDQDAYWANGRKYLLNPDLKNFRYDGNRKPIHGLVVFASDWKVVASHADSKGASVTSRLEFWRQPDRLAQFPFPHNYEMTYRLSDGVLEVRTEIENLATEPMPVSHGFHTYYQVPDSPRDDWKVHVAAKEHVELSDVLIPTGERKPVRVADPQPLAGTQFDDVFTGLVRGADGRAEFWVQGKSQKISVSFGPKYTVGVIYAPKAPGRDFICFEPMTGVTNQFNLAHEGKFSELLQSVPPGGKWAESFWVRPSGF